MHYDINIVPSDGEGTLDHAILTGREGITYVRIAFVGGSLDDADFVISEALDVLTAEIDKRRRAAALLAESEAEAEFRQHAARSGEVLCHVDHEALLGSLCPGCKAVV